MRLRNVLIAVNDMDMAIRFYKEIFGLDVILNQDGNVILSEGLVLQDAKIWKRFLDKDLIPENNMTELYFEETDIEGFVRKLEESDFEALMREHKEMNAGLSSGLELKSGRIPDKLEDATRLHIRRVYEKYGQNLTRAAEALDVSRNTVRKYL